MTNDENDAPLEITDLNRAEAARSQHMPDRAEIRELLVRYFVGPIDDAHVTRLADMFERDHESEWRAYRSQIESPTKWRGWAWNEEVTENRRGMAPIDHVLLMGHMLWNGFRRAPHLCPPFPQPKLYCPAVAVGTWEQLGPVRVTNGPCLWHLNADSSFETNSPDVPKILRYWCVHRNYHFRPHQFEIRLRDQPDNGAWSVVDCEVKGNELIGKHDGYMNEIPFRFRRITTPLKGGAP